MNDRQQEQASNHGDDDVSFDFWKTNYSGRLEKSLHFQESPLAHDIFEGIHRTEEDLWRVEGFDKGANRKLQNRMNAKRAREKKKGEVEDMRIRIQNLEIENRNLRQQKTCRWCRKSLEEFPAHSVHIEKGHAVEEKRPAAGKELFFEEIKYPQNRREWKGKIWLAIGLLMLVIGLQMHGLTGSDEKSVRVCEKEAKEWAAQFEEPDRADLKIRMKTKNSPEMRDEKWEGRGAKQKEGWLSGISFESEESFGV